MSHSRARKNTSGWGQRDSVMYRSMAEMLFTMKIYSKLIKCNGNLSAQKPAKEFSSILSLWDTLRGMDQSLRFLSDIAHTKWGDYLKSVVCCDAPPLPPCSDSHYHFWLSWWFQKSVTIGPCIGILSSLLVKSSVSCGKTWMGVSVCAHISSLLSSELPLCDGRWKAKWSFFVHHASPLTLLQGPRTVTTQTASSPIILQRPADTHWCLLHSTSNLLVDSAGWKGFRWVCGQPQAFLCLRRGEELGGMKIRKSRGSGTLCSTMA